MYYPNAYEDVCYEQDHIEKVWEEMKKNISDYFQQYVDTEGGHVVHESEMDALVAKFSSTAKPKNKIKNHQKSLQIILMEAIKDFENERDQYLSILNLESFKDYKLDVNSFKNTILRNQIPIIRKTLQNKMAKELDKYRIAFKNSQSGELFEVCERIITLAVDWKNDRYNDQKFEKIDTLDDFNYYELDEDEFAVFGVVGGGIKSHFIYKLYPEMFPNRSREAVWALYYLSNKKNFGCKEDSEFLMINIKEGNTQQNYFYPYALFSFYALRIFNYLKELYAKHGVILPAEYRFVAVDCFLSFVSRSHQSEIDLLKQRSINSYQYEH